MRSRRERAEILWNWDRYGDAIERAAKKVLGYPTKVYVFGSAVRGELMASSDVDILIVTERKMVSLTERNKLAFSIETEAGLPLIHPFELHVVDIDEAEMYFRHAKGDLLPLKAVQGRRPKV